MHSYCSLTSKTAYSNITRKPTVNLLWKNNTQPKGEHRVFVPVFSPTNCFQSPQEVQQQRPSVIYRPVTSSLPLTIRTPQGSWHLLHTADFATRSWGTYLLRTSLERMGVSRLNVDFMESVEQLS